MNILLLVPPSTIYGADPTVPAMIPPLGLAYIAGYLEKFGYAPKILDARIFDKNNLVRKDNKVHYGFTDQEVLKYFNEFKPDVVGITSMYTAYSGDAHRMAKLAKQYNKNTITVFGGAHASTFSELVLKDENIDVVIHGEGEATFLDLVNHINDKKDFTNIEGISLRKNGVYSKNTPREYIPDLDTIPFPARHLLDMKLYLENIDATYTMRAPYTTIVTNRGCPNACVYCTIKQVWGKRKWRGRSAKNVVDEIELMHKQYGIQEFHLLDDSAGTSKKRIIEICDEIVARKLDIKWTTPNGIAHWLLDENVLDKMKAAGCYRVTFGIESGNIETRKMLGKPFPLSQATRMLEHANKIGMWTICTFILGFPYETKEQMMDTINYAKTAPMDLAVFYLLCPHPGTDIYEVFKTEGLLNFDHILDHTAVIDEKHFEEIGKKLCGHGARTKHFNPDEMQKMLSLAYKSFFKARLLRGLNPMNTLYKIRDKEDFKYTLRIGKIGLSKTLNTILAKRFKVQDFREQKIKDLDKANA